MAWNGLRLSGNGIVVDIVFGSMPEQLASGGFESSDQINAFHAMVN